MYFKSRQQAGQLLKVELAKKYANQPTAIAVMSDGGVVVAAEIAEALKCVVTMLLTESIKIPGETAVLGTINQDGGFNYNANYSFSQLEELKSEFRGNIDEQKVTQLSKLHRLFGKGGLIRRDLLQDHNVILVSDGLNTGLTIDSAAEYLKPIRIKSLVIATPLAGVNAVERMHILADDVYCLSVVEDCSDLNHYYEDNTIPSHASIIETIENIVTNWV